MVKIEYKATNYESDLTDKQWEEIKEFFPSGNKSKYSKRAMAEAVLYLIHTGCQWRMLPHDYPPYTAQYGAFTEEQNGMEAGTPRKNHQKKCRKEWESKLRSD